MFAFLAPRTPRAAPPTLPRILQIGGREITVEILRTPRARRLTLRLHRSGAAARVTAPMTAREGEIADFLTRNLGWIEKRLAAYPDRPLIGANVKVPFRGVPHLIVHHAGRGVTETRQGANGPEIHVFGPSELAGRRLADWLKREARRTIEPMALTLAERTGKKARAIRFKDTVSRWGSCTSDGTLAFSWRIMMAPNRVIAYLVAHEVAHLTEMNHGPRFWALCKTLCPDTDECRAWLKRNGTKLQAIRFDPEA
jgi:predicted metal-dependent hydrolase